MVKLQIKGTQTEIICPTRLGEVTADALERLTHNFNVQPNFCIVALVNRAPITQIAFASNTGKFKDDAKIGVTCVLAKLREEDEIKTDMHIGDILTIDHSSVERGHHLGISTGASINFILNALSADSSLKEAFLKHELTDDKGNVVTELVTLSFKIVPVCTIVSALNPTSVLDDPFKVIAGKTRG